MKWVCCNCQIFVLFARCFWSPHQCSYWLFDVSELILDRVVRPPQMLELSCKKFDHSLATVLLVLWSSHINIRIRIVRILIIMRILVLIWWLVLIWRIILIICKLRWWCSHELICMIRHLFEVRVVIHHLTHRCWWYLEVCYL